MGAEMDMMHHGDHNNTFINKWVFKLFLNLFGTIKFLNSTGNVFYSRGAAAISKGSVAKGPRFGTWLYECDRSWWTQCALCITLLQKLTWKSGALLPYPANTIHRPHVGSMLGQRRRRWTNIEPTLGKCIVLNGYELQDLEPTLTTRRILAYFNLLFFTASRHHDSFRQLFSPLLCLRPEGIQIANKSSTYRLRDLIVFPRRCGSPIFLPGSAKKRVSQHVPVSDWVMTSRLDQAYEPRDRYT